MAVVVRRRRWPSVSRPIRNALVWLAAITLLILIGAVGYMGIEGWDFFDSLYMTVGILATVGLKEIHPMDRTGEAWTILLSIVGVGIIFGTVGIAAEAVLAEMGGQKREVRRMQTKVDALRGHFIVCGYGRVGSLVAKELREDGQQVVVLDVDPQSLHRAVGEDFLVVPGNGTSDEVLVKAGVERARGLVTAIDSDADNVYVTISARTLNPELFIVARASSSAVMGKLTQAGADRAISPYKMAGNRIVQLALRPGVVDFIDAALSRGDLSFGMEEVTVDDRLAGTTVGQLRGQGLFTLAIRHDPGTYEPTPADERRLERGESLIVSGSTRAMRALGEST